MQSENVARVYDKIAAKYARVFDRDHSDEPFLDVFLNYLSANGKILDLGCGTGRLTGYFSKKGFRVTGLDFSKEIFVIARCNYPKIDFVCQNMLELNFPRGSFDGISLGYSLFHVPRTSVPLLLEKIHKTLAENGVLFIVLQEGNGEVYLDEPLAPGEKLFVALYSKTEIRELLSEAGFEVVYENTKQPQAKGELPYDKLIIVAKKK